jgi:hypothetical protein
MTENDAASAALAGLAKLTPAVEKLRRLLQAAIAADGGSADGMAGQPADNGGGAATGGEREAEP